MKIDISSILKASEGSLNVEFEETIDNKGMQFADVEIKDPVRFKGVFVNDGESVKLEGVLGFSFSVDCCRCLSGFDSEMEVTIKEDFVDVDKAKEDVYTYQGKIVDLDKVFVDNILLNLPSRHVCKEDCKGLCAICGGDLNKVSCNCTKEDINPAMEALKGFFKD